MVHVYVVDRAGVALLFGEDGLQRHIVVPKTQKRNNFQKNKVKLIKK